MGEYSQGLVCEACARGPCLEMNHFNKEGNGELLCSTRLI